MAIYKYKNEEEFEATDVELEGNKVSLIQMVLDNGELLKVIYRASDRLFFVYIDSDGQEKTISYTIEYLKENKMIENGILKVQSNEKHYYGKTVVYLFNEPLKTLLSDKVSSHSIVSKKLLEVIDTSNQISSLGEQSLTNLSKMRTIDIPSLQRIDSNTLTSNGFSYINCKNLNYIGGNAFDGCSNIKYFDINNDTFITLDNYGNEPKSIEDEKCLVVDRKLYESTPKNIYIKAIARGVKILSSDYIYSLDNNILAVGGVTDAYLKNLSSTNDIFANAYSISNLVVDNDIMKTVDNGYGYRVCKVTKKDNKLIEISPAILNVKLTGDSKVDDFSQSCFRYSLKLSTLDITDTSYFGGKVILDKSNTKILFMSKYPSNTHELNDILNSEELKNVSCFEQYSVAKNCYVDTLSSDNILEVKRNAFGEVNITTDPKGTLHIMKLYFPNLTATGTMMCQGADVSYADLRNLKIIGTQDFGYVTTRTVRSGLSVYAPIVERIGSQAFWYRTSMTRVDFPNVDTIQQQAFTGCKSLKDINIQSVKNISYSAFVDCASLTNLYFPQITSIGYDPFRNCYELTSITIAEDNYNFRLLDENNICSNTGIVLLDENNKTVLWGSIKKCKNVVIGNDLTSINSYAFYNCNNLIQISCPSITHLKNNAFGNCISVNNIYLQNCENFGTNSLYECKNLQTLCCNYVTMDYMSENMINIGFLSSCSCFCSDGIYYGKTKYPY